MTTTANEKLAIIKIGDFDYNYMNKEGINDWFKFVGYFIKDGFARVQRSDSLYNLIDKKGNFISNEWFKLIGDFDDNGLALIQRKDSKWNFIDKQGNFISNEWFSWVDDFKDGFAVVYRTNGERCKIDKTGKIVSK